MSAERTTSQQVIPSIMTPSKNGCPIKYGLITAVALVSMGSAVTGIVTLLGFLPFGSHVGIGAISFGGLGVLSLGAYGFIHSCKYKNATPKPVGNDLWKKWDDGRKKDWLKKKFEKIYVSPDKVEQALALIKDWIPAAEQTVVACDEDRFNYVCDILSFDVTELLDMKIQDMQSDLKQLGAVLFRLAVVPNIPEAREFVEVNENTTLGELLETKISYEQWKTLPQALKGILQASQIEAICKSKEPSKEEVKDLFPTCFGSEHYTENRLRQLSKGLIFKLVENKLFENSCILLLPECHFSDENFPWDAIDFPNLLKYISRINNTSRIKIIFKLIPNLKLINIFQYVKADHLPYLESRIENQEFPWEEMLKKEGIARELRWYFISRGGEGFSFLSNFWKQVVKDQAILDEIFATEPEKKWLETKEMFKRIPCACIPDLAQHLPVNFLLYFDKGQLANPCFPWEDFINKVGFGSTLREMKTLSCISMPWEKLAAKQKEIDNLFVMETTHDKFLTETLVNSLSAPALASLAPSLPVGLLRLCNENTLRESDFPWEVFIQKKGIAEVFRNYIFNKKLKEFQIPWEKFLENGDEIPVLLVLPADNPLEYSKTEGIIQQIKIRNAELLTQMIEIAFLDEEEYKNL